MSSCLISAASWRMKGGKTALAIAAASGLDGEDLVSAATDAVYASGYITGKGTRSDFWRLLREKTGLRGEADWWWREILSRFVLRAPMMDWVKKLKAAGLVVGILSDQIDMLDAPRRPGQFFSNSIMSSTVTTWAKASAMKACLTTCRISEDGAWPDFVH